MWGKVIFSEGCIKNSVHGGGGIPACIAGDISACLAGIEGGGGIPACLVGGISTFLAWGVSRPTPKGEAEGSGQVGGSPGPHLGVSRPTPRVVSRPTLGGLCIPAFTEADPLPWTATAAGSTHPTGMYSCFRKLFVDINIK